MKEKSQQISSREQVQKNPEGAGIVEVCRIENWNVPREEMHAKNAEGFIQVELAFVQLEKVRKKLQ